MNSITYSQNFVQDQKSLIFGDISTTWKELRQSQIEFDAYISKFVNFELFCQSQKSDLQQKTQNFDSSLDAQQNDQAIKEKEKNEEINLDQDQDFDKQQLQVQVQGSSATKEKRQRPTDHNICKKFHTIANRCLRKLGLYQFIKPQLKKIHKRNYFILVLIIADKSKKLKQFKRIYNMRIKHQSLNYKKVIQGLNNTSQKYNYYQQIISAIQASICSISLYQKGSIHESMLNLFQVDKMKRQSIIEQSSQELSLFIERIQREIDRALTRI